MTTTQVSAPSVLCIGAVLWDYVGLSAAPAPRGADLPGRIARMPGGVALNVALALARLGLRPALLSAVGADPEGAALLAEAAAAGCETGFVWRSGDLPTGRYLAIEDAAGLVAAIADVQSLEAAGARILAPLTDGRLGGPDAPWSGPIVIDGNLGPALLAEIGAAPGLARADLRIVPASPAKADRLAMLVRHPRATVYANRSEAERLCGRRFADAQTAALGLVAVGAARALVTDGDRSAADAVPGRLLTARPPQVAVGRVTGAGDNFVAAHIAAELQGHDAAAALDRALAAATAHVAAAVPA